MRNLYLILIFCLTTTAKAEIDFNISALSSKTSYNYFSLPNENEANRFDITSTNSAIAYRFFFEKFYADWSFTILYAPLSLDYQQTSDREFKFNNTNFEKDKITNITYKFNSYRIGYRRNYKYSFGRFYYGGILKIRDAEICVSQAGLKDCYDNIGPVPLLVIGAELTGELLYSKFNIDGLFSSRGSAYDANFEVGINLGNSKLGMGYRILGGGANSDKLINFAQFQSWYIGLTI